ncbi:hypothetical protein [Xanthomonas campestris]|uniref:hypothetical protein n=1 Tax=Xanthomonas campestris TaxID=339 RepID=UPI001E64FE23|nr:hypothetical protein [Xanthomonas campestris]MCC5086943.1 hypothetical protein [Xanthomonas campestris]
MQDEREPQYQEMVLCEGRQDEGVIFIKVVALPGVGAVEFDTASAYRFVAQLQAAIAHVEAGWVGSPGTADERTPS